MRYEHDWDQKPKTKGRLAQLNKFNRSRRRESEAILLWRRIEPTRTRDIFR